MESVDVRLARMEEGMVRLHDKLDATNDKIDGVGKALHPYVEMSRKSHDQILTLTRDRFWVFMLCGAAGTFSGILVDALLRIKFGA